MNAERTFDIMEATATPERERRADLHPTIARGHGFRSEAAAPIAFRWIDRSVQALAAGLARWRRQRQTRNALMGCSDRVLEDIGIAREHIALVAKGIDPADDQLSAPGLRRWWAAAHARLDAARVARRERRRLFRELDAYSDRELEEIGLRRGDISLIARGRPVLQRVT
jgi:uncharacterized protein YjiS (DUF1127 family)